jgi:hypothetical protein
MPYCIVDAHYGLSVSERLADTTWGEYSFTQACNVVIGRVLDAHLTQANDSSSDALASLNESLDLIEKSRPVDWWTICPVINTHSIEAMDRTREKLLFQTTFFHIRMYVHLPLLLRPNATQGSKACVEAAEEMLNRIILLRDGTRATRLFDCKSMDFMGFVAAAVILLDPTQGSNRGGIGVVEQLRRQFEQEVEATKCDAARRYAMALDELLKHSEDSPGRGVVKIKLPYFGVVMKNPERHGHHEQELQVDETMQDIHDESGDLHESTLSEPDELPSSIWRESDTLWEMIDVDSFSFDDVFPWLDQSAQFGFDGDLP